MRLRLWIVPLVLLAFAGCGRRHVREYHPLKPERRAAVESSVRSFVLGVAHDVTTQGPEAWQQLLANDPAFFMAVDGRMVFPNRQAATQGIHDFSHTIKHIELHWGGDRGDDLRIDALTPSLAVVAASYSEVQAFTDGHQVTENGFFTGVAEYRNGRWQFRDAHWSSVPPPKIP